MKRRIFVDTEWTAPPWSERAELMWIGLADEEGRSWYGISSEVNINPSTNDFISGAFRLITPDEPRMSRQQPRRPLGLVRQCGRVLGVDPISREVRRVVWLGRRSIRCIWPVLEHQSSDAPSPCKSLASRFASTCTTSTWLHAPASRFHLGLQTTSIHVSTPNGIGNCWTHPRNRQPLKVSVPLEELLEV